MSETNDKLLFKDLLDNLPEGVYYTDRERRIKYWNRASTEITGYTSDEVVGRSCADNILVHVDDDGNCLCRSGCPLAACINDGNTRRARVYLHHKEGHRVPVDVSASVIRDATGNIIGAVEAFSDASAAAAALAEIGELREHALVCPLTGVGNRRHSEEVLRQKLDEKNRTHGLLSILFIDIDHFKAINDTYGHQVGDMVLKMVARTLAAAMRSYDFLGRWGGEELLAILPNAARGETERIAERLRMLVNHSSREVSGNRISVTVSIGAYCCRDDDAESAVARADELMYRSKAAGRNRVTIG